LKSTKTGENREVPLLAEVRVALLALAGRNPWGPQGFIFHSAKPDVPMDIKRLLDPLIEQFICMRAGTEDNQKGAEEALAEWRSHNLIFQGWRHFYSARMADLIDARRIMLATKVVLIVKSNDAKIKTFSDLKGNKVVANLTTTYVQLARENGAEVTSSDLPFDLVSQSRADATINDRLFFLDYKKQKPDVALKIVAEHNEVDYQGVIVRKGNPELVATINKALKDLKADGTYLRISQKYFGEDFSR
jgi:hypothetical protein